MSGRPLNRIAPQLPVGAMKTYQAIAPPDQTVIEACASVGCAAWRQGWDTVVDEDTDLGKRQAAYIRQNSGRTFKELRSETGLTVFRFESGQRCFANHETRPARFLVRGGDHRSNLGVIREHVGADDWVEDFALHQDHLAERIGRG
jgi:hypothetical protein